ncbi:hypothetical protein [Planomonospora parontospora]|uniref:hypothetical protein n=1 Tax=Planomonospora parontospora TaxID=58119 RepID=UPI001670FDED|nr:hypothetical protein [Planomonospora parontospora]GGL35557.1 hypothetical protein GCM10014719_40900 [Planomonospora parontospora subsp. antibiotica]GII17470.1 hypothetical protein Ppa05_41960 [Planomonospora parontospora subsp. antibiotica]
MTADRNNPGSRDDENTPRDPGPRDGDTRNLPAQDDAPTAHTPTDAYGAPAAYGPGGTGAPAAYGPHGSGAPAAYGLHGPGDTGWNVPGPHTPTDERPRPGRYARIARATRGKPFQVAAAAVIGAVLGGGTVAVVDTIGDRHRAGNASNRVDDHRTPPGDGFDRLLEGRGDEGYGAGERGNGETRIFQGGSDEWNPGDGFRMPDQCESTQDGFRCAAPTSAPFTP